MPKLDSIQFCGGSGCRYDFRVYLWGHHFKPVAAVYVITERRLEPDGKVQYLPIYVGETIDLSRIFENHPCEECFQVYFANTVAAFAEEDSKNRKAIVLDLLSVIKPPCKELESS